MPKTLTLAVRQGDRTAFIDIKHDKGQPWAYATTDLLIGDRLRRGWRKRWKTTDESVPRWLVGEGGPPVIGLWLVLVACGGSVEKSNTRQEPPSTQIFHSRACITWPMVGSPCPRTFRLPQEAPRWPSSRSAGAKGTPWRRLQWST